MECNAEDTASFDEFARSETSQFDPTLTWSGTLRDGQSS
jgi:hypothetical protein